jgi:hypothetical protein
MRSEEIAINAVKEKNTIVYFTKDEVIGILKEIASKAHPILNDISIKVYTSGFEGDEIRFYWEEEIT